MDAPQKSVGVKFARDGPAIPIELLQAFEDGNVVVFCGAGVSRGIGLPDFAGLVSTACARLGRPMDPDEQTSFEANAFDVALGLIESRIGKVALRRAVREVLEVKPQSNLSTHEALLQLATSKERRLRLVTTNFDQAFELAPYLGKRAFDYAPYLPHPGNTWNSIVHLHGGLGNDRDPEGQSLVLTSADFGRAYITEAWASRFLAELFRRTSAVLFIGYSVSDPAIRYIVDAFAADRANQESRVAKAYLFTGASPDYAAQDEKTWKSRGIDPIIYDPRDDHHLLHETIQCCAKRYRSGFFDRESIVLEYGRQSPLGGLDQEAISQITWALNDESGHAARGFARIDPAPSLEWLEVLDVAGLINFNAQAQGALPIVAGISLSQFVPFLHPVPSALCKWLCSHLAAPRFLEWTIKHGGHLHPFLADEVRKRVAKDATIPGGLALIWRFLSARGAPVYSHATHHAMFLYGDAVQQHAWSPLLRDLVLSWLAPTIHLKEPFRLGLAEDFEERVRTYVDVELLPAVGENSWYLADRLLARHDADQTTRELIGEVTGILY